MATTSTSSHRKTSATRASTSTATRNADASHQDAQISAQQKTLIKINYLEVQNFKSYADYHYIGPFMNFTCIIGPNGGGKSNVADALCFAFGVETKSLRSDKIVDLIYRRDLLVQAERKTKEARSCYVSVCFTCSDNTELKIRRSIDPKGAQTYHIDGTQVTKTEYFSLLHYNKINYYMKNFLLMQGEIDTIANKSPQDLALYFEHLSGSFDCKGEYDRLKEILTEKESEVKDLSHRINGWKNEKKHLRQSIDNLSEYSNVVREIEELEVTNELYNFLEQDAAIVKMIKDFEPYDEELERLTTERNNLNLQIQREDLAQRNLSKELKELEKKFNDSKSTAMEKSTELISLKDQQQHLEAAISAKKLSLKKLREQLDTLNQSVKKLTQAKEQLEAERAEVMKQLQAQDSKDKEAVSNSKIYEEYKAVEKRSREKLTSMLQELEKLYELQNLGVSKEQNTEIALKNKDELLRQLDMKLKDVDTQSNIKKTDSTRLEKEIKSLKDQLAALSKERQSKLDNRQNLQKLKEQHNQLLRELTFLDQNRRDQISSNELYQNLHQLAKGFRGELASLLKAIQPKYEVALKIALGKALNYLVVDREETAQICSEILRDQGMMKDILILENIPTVNPKNIQTLRGQLGTSGLPASDVIEFERSVPGLEKAVLHLLNGKIVCETLDKGESVRKKNLDLVKQIITLDGNVFKKGCVVGYGDVEKLVGGTRLASTLNQNLEGEIAKAYEKLNSVETQIRELKTEEEDIKLSRLQEQLKEAETNYAALQDELKSLKEQHDYFESEIKATEKAISSFKWEITKLQTSKTQSEENIAKLKKKVEDREQEFFADFCKTYGFKNIQEFRGKTAFEMESIYVKKEKIEEKIRSIEKEIARVPIQKTQDEIEQFEKSLKEKEAALKELTSSFNKETDASKKNDKTYEKLRAELEKKQKELQDKTQRISDLTAERNQLSAKYTAKDREKKDLLAKIHKAILNKDKIHTDLKIRAIDVPYLLDVSQTSRKSRSQISQQMGVYVDFIKKHFKEDRLLVIDYSSIESEIEELFVEGEGAGGGEMMIEQEDWMLQLDRQLLNGRKREVQTKLEQKQAKLDSIGAHSTKLIDADLKDKIATLDRKIKEGKETLDERHNELERFRNEFEAVKEKRLQIFNTFFDRMAAIIDQVYKAVTQNPRVPNLGGTAILKKENSIEPYLGGIFYSATPPTKKMVYDTSQLSGGERSLAGIALLLATNIVNRLHFMIFDESDAFLDNDNASTLLKVIMKISEEYNIQILFITHKSIIYENAESLVGATFVPRKVTSEIFSLDLRE